MKPKTLCVTFMGVMLVLVFITTKLNIERMKVESRWILPSPTMNVEINREYSKPSGYSSLLRSLPQGIMESTSDLELRPLWSYTGSKFQGGSVKSTALLAIPAGLKQKNNVDDMVKKFLSANCSILLFHYDGNMDAWNDLEWTNKAVHIVAHNQTKWWFAKRFLHPDVVSIYDYIFLWDEDLGVENFDPGRYLQIMASEGLEISQPALDPELSEVHHRITVRNRKGKVHRRVYAILGSHNCSDETTGPPCAGWVEGMAPVFSRAAWRCVWHLIQNDLIHGWGLDMKLGYCAQGDRNEKIGVIDSEYVIHQGIPSLGGPSASKAPSYKTLDLRTHIRRQSTAELEVFKHRWDQAVKEDEEWIDPFENSNRK